MKVELSPLDYLQAAAHEVRMRQWRADSDGEYSVHHLEIPLEIDARINQVDGELEIEATTNAPHREPGMTWNPLRIIRPHSRLLVKGRLTR